MTAGIESDDKSYIFQAKIDKKSPEVVGGKGIRLDIKKDGVIHKHIIDAMTGATVGALGWVDEQAQEFMCEAAQNHVYTYPTTFNNRKAEDLAKFYIEHSPAGVLSSAMWCCSGSESNENALKIIRQYQIERGMPKKKKIISREISYHGFTLGAISVSGNLIANSMKDILIDQENICLKMPICYPYRGQKKGETEGEYVIRLLNSLEDIILFNDPATISTVLVETIPGSSLGTVPPPPGYLPGLRAMCNKYDIIFMLDEVMCGTGRVNPNGRLNCWENFLQPEEAPDIQTVGKTLGSGYVTIAGVLVGPKIKDTIVNGTGTIKVAHTYSSHGFSCAVALEVQKKIQKEKLTANVFEKGNLMGQQLQTLLLPKHNIVGDVRGLGGFWTIEFVKNKETKETFPFALDVGHRFQAVCFENGLNVMGMQGCVNSTSGDHALLAPSFIITDGDVSEIVGRIEKSVQELGHQLRAEGEWK